jgi:hypothetical protein
MTKKTAGKEEIDKLTRLIERPKVIFLLSEEEICERFAPS